MRDLIYVLIAITIVFIISFFEKRTKNADERQQKVVVKQKHHRPLSPKRQQLSEPVEHSTAHRNFPLPEEGIRVSTDNDDSLADIQLKERQKKINRHRQKWREAIINAEILTPKF